MNIVGNNNNNASTAANAQELAEIKAKLTHYDSIAATNRTCLQYLGGSITGVYAGM